ncbi:MAG: Hit-like protein involved in cell-cycle regulation [archaeon GW2011_AR3]|nr:MAG: Hit-like protein involved in cell-cycle regulation [archaeon GW2011_AR3]MBS3110113.1 HIT domain-containing protein [Candidatus Woesearchaeota archaeon]
MSSENAACMVCQAVASGTGMAVYEDDEVVAYLDENPAAYGHLAVIPKSHHPIIEETPDYLVNHVFQVVNKLSVVVFEELKVQGTNILVSNGIAAGQDLPHFMVNIIPRTEGDGLNFQWQAKHLSEEEMSTVEIVLKEQSASIGAFELKKKDEAIVLGKPEEIISSAKERKKEPKAEEKKEEKADEPQAETEEENYLIRHLRRIA